MARNTGLTNLPVNIFGTSLLDNPPVVVGHNLVLNGGNGIDVLKGGSATTSSMAVAATTRLTVGPVTTHSTAGLAPM